MQAQLSGASLLLGPGGLSRPLTVTGHKQVSCAASRPSELRDTPGHPSWPAQRQAASHADAR